jgi:hypothetical protein
MDEDDLQYVVLKQTSFIWHRPSVWNARRELKGQEQPKCTGGLQKLGYMALNKFWEAQVYWQHPN